MSADSNKETNWCPNCGYDYESWVEVCPDCGGLLTPRRNLRLVKGGLDDGDDPQWTIVTNVPNAIIGKLIQSQLEDAGIPVVMLRSRSADSGMFTHNDFVPYDLRVPKQFWDEARRLVYSRPGDLESDSLDVDDMQGDEEEPEEEEREDSQQYRMPERWRSLPPSPSLLRDSGSAPPGWRWTSGEDSSFAPEREESEPPRPTYRPRWRDEVDPRDYDLSGQSGQPRWIRICYGILLAAISLPFILQLIEEIGRIFTGNR